MDFLKDHSPLKDPQNQNFKSAFVGLYPYHPSKNTLQSNLKVALYAWDEDYHTSLSQKLQAIAQELEEDFPGESFKAAVDSFPVLERDLAYRAGLGWMGKNTCLLNKEHGSLFYIAEILTSLKSKTTPEFKTDHCGTCTKCIDSCPTGALTPRKLEVDKCISYRNIEDKDRSLKTLEKPLHGWFFGCDICQTVCPWNEKTHGKDEMATLSQPFHFSPESITELKNILSQSNKELMETYKDFPLNRARGSGLKRNALKLIYENKLSELKDFLERLTVPEQLEDLRSFVAKSLGSIL